MYLAEEAELLTFRERLEKAGKKFYGFYEICMFVLMGIIYFVIETILWSTDSKKKF